jgi:DNA-binding PadR family transcriptional regulator
MALMIPRPMKPQWFHILLALGGKELHGYGIQRAVLDQTDGEMRLWPAMLYRSLATLEEGGLISRVDPPADEPDDERRQYYHITRAGRVRLSEETRLLARWVEAARNVEPI